MIISEMINTSKMTGGKPRNISAENIDAISSFIKKNCSKILQVINETHMLMYRGCHVENVAVFLGKPFAHRRPLNTSPIVDNALARVLKQTGFSARRENSIFVSSDLVMTKFYGKTYVIFPLNGFKYTWCRLGKDLTLQFELSKREFDEKTNIFYNDLITMAPQDFVAGYQFKNNEGLNNALQLQNEIYIHGRYIAIALENRIFNEIINNLFTKDTVAEIIHNDTVLIPYLTVSELPHPL
jgi:hypothetical protein